MSDPQPQHISTENPAMAKPQPKAKSKPSGVINGVYSEQGSGAIRPADYETLRKEGWIADALLRAWPMLIVVAGGIFAAGGLWVKIDTTKEWHLEERAAILAQGKSIEDIKAAFADFRVDRAAWVAENDKRRSAPVPDERQKAVATPKRRVYHKPSGLDGLLH